MDARLRAALARAAEVARELSGPEVAKDTARLQELGREHSRLEPVVRTHDRLVRLQEELAQAREMAAEPDPELAEMARADVERTRATSGEARGRDRGTAGAARSAR